ncbi:MAG: GC-type dockerin domain-anchored protein, partial [Planctomycetota bacterium]
GATWTLIDSRPHSGEWEDLRYDLAGFAGGGAGTMLRFSVVDTTPASIIESAIDAVQIRSVACNACPADVNGDGELNPDDFNAWVAAFNTQSSACDQNADGACNPADFSAWVINFNSGC